MNKRMMNIGISEVNQESKERMNKKKRIGVFWTKSNYKAENIRYRKSDMRTKQVPKEAGKKNS